MRICLEIHNEGSNLPVVVVFKLHILNLRLKSWAKMYVAFYVKTALVLTLAPDVIAFVCVNCSTRSDWVIPNFAMIEDLARVQHHGEH